MKPIKSFVFSSLLMLSAGVILPIPSIAASIGSQGSFMQVEKPTSGTAKIVKEGNKTYVELGPDFKTSTDGPDLKVILAKPSKLPVHLKGMSYIKLSPLKNFTGKQRYEIPATVNLKEINTVGIWCEQFDATFGFAPLK
ncbi:DM13 domain-containing protein [Synechocystis sp. LKSZ1]|uniref:DM13 domain-containing protein n=1 Tax=Synechocystis sp. LKSZ1 TaxID=3144951 RepID=UPI00336BEB0A